MAVVLVVLDHLLKRPAGGFIGVDVFFVISGYLITTLLVQESDRAGRVSIGDFYARRIRRIVPLAVLVLVSTVIAAHFVLLASRARETLTDSAWALGFLANVHFSAIGTDYFQQARPPSAVQHFWSLSVEEQFYLVWPLLVAVGFVLARRRRANAHRTFGVLAAVATVGSFFWCLHVTSVSATSAYFSTPARAWELGVGALTALVAARARSLPSPARALLSWLGLLGILSAAVLFSSDTLYPGVATVLPVASAACLLVASNPKGGAGGRFALGSKLFTYVGRRSYSLYLWHWPCIVLSAAYFGASGARYYVSAGVLPLALSVFSFRFVEDPIRRSNWLGRTAQSRDVQPKAPRQYALDPKQRDGLLVAASAVVVALCFWTAVPTPGGGALAPTTTTSVATASAVTPTQMSPTQSKIAEALKSTAWGPLQPSLDELPSARAAVWKACGNVTSASTQQRCLFGTGKRTAVLFGDSFALSWAPGVIAALQAQDYKVQLLTLGECPVADVTVFTDAKSRAPFTECDQTRAANVQWIVKNHPDLVVAADSYGLAANVLNAGQAGVYARWKDGMNETLSAIRPATGRLVVLGGPPGSGNLQACVTRVSVPAACVTSVSSAWVAIRSAEQAAAQANDAIYADPLDWFCFARKCPAVVGDTPVYWDGGHMTAQYSAQLAPLLAPALLG